MTDLIMRGLPCLVQETTANPGARKSAGIGAAYHEENGELTFFIEISDGSTKGVIAQLDADEYRAFVSLIIDVARIGFKFPSPSVYGAN